MKLLVALALLLVSCGDNLAAPSPPDSEPHCIHCGDPHAQPNCDGGYSDQAGVCHHVTVHKPDAVVIDAG